MIANIGPAPVIHNHEHNVRGLLSAALLSAITQSNVDTKISIVLLNISQNSDL